MQRASWSDTDVHLLAIVYDETLATSMALHLEKLN